MQSAAVRRYAEIISRTIVFVTLLVVVYVAVWTFTSRKFKTESSLQKGNLIARLPDYDYADSQQTLIIAINVECSYCNESLHFYHHLAGINDHSNTQIILTFQNSITEIERYMKENQIDLDTATGVSFSSLKIDTTPTIILVDNKGKVINFWIGKLSPSEEEQIVNYIS